MHIVIIGAGPGGYEAAIKAAQLGAEVTLVERNRVGGTCLNRGCIPTKTLLHAAHFVNLARESERYGVAFGAVSVDFQKTQKKKEEVVQQLVTGVEFLLRKHKIKLVCGQAEFLDPHTVRVVDDAGKNRNISGDSFIIATGSEPLKLPVEGIDLPQVVDSTGALSMTAIPKKLVIIGGGVIGMEFAEIFSAFGAQVEIIEMLPSIIAAVDPDIASVLASEMDKKGVTVHVNSRLVKIANNTDGNVVVYFKECEKERELPADCVLISIGRKPNTDNLGLEKAGVKVVNGYIETDHRLRTDVPHIYAIGDVRNGGLKLAHSASHEGIQAVKDAVKGEQEKRQQCVPSCIFTVPEIACVGLTEEQARSAGYEINIGTFSYQANGKALSMNAGTGMVKIIAEKECGQILGAHIAGAHAGDLIHEVAAAIDGEFDAETLGELIHAHPTLSEIVMEAALDCDGNSIHNPPKRMR